MSLFRELSYDGADIDNIKSIQFCLLDPDEVKRRSVVHVTTTDTYVGNEPVLNGPYDPRMGVTDASRLCGTCEQRSTFCPGHFGHIEMAMPVFYYQYMPFLKKILQCVCIRCSKLMYDLETPEIQGIVKRSHRMHRFSNVHKMCSKIVTCGQHNQHGCGARNPDKVTKNSIKGFLLEWKAGVLEDDNLRKQNFGAEEVLNIMRRITDADVEALGLSPQHSRPEWMICTVLPVPPPAVRPCVHHETGQRQEDDLSYTLGHIIKNNNTLAAKIKKGDRQDYIDGFALQLQYYVATLVDNQISGITPPTHKRSGRTLRSLSDRLKGKEGRIRGNLMGKRVDFSARSVITPDPNISIDEVGVPLRIAMNLTFPETVSELNREFLQAAVRNGPDVYPGAKMVRKSREGGRLVRLKNVLDRSDIKLENGDIVERHLLNGDYVLFNRQPSLHRMSMMGHRVRVMPFNTFRISTSVCTSFNADFDGDEMNMHVPQSHTTAVELERLASVNTQIISPKDSKPIIQIVQDTVLGVWRLTQDDVRLDRRSVYSLLAVCDRVPRVPAPFEVDPVRGPLWTGKQVLSAILPPTISTTVKNKLGQEVIIQNGQILSGTVDSSVFQSMTNGLVHSTFAECGPLATRDLFDNTQKIVCNYLVNTGFSVGVSDLVASQEVDDYLQEVSRDMKHQVYQMIDSVHAGTFVNPEIMRNGQYLESQLNSKLNEARDLVNDAIEKIMKDSKDNRMLQMILSGAKGKMWNITQMLGFLGQQNVEGERVAEGFENRTLPHFTRYDDGPDARGWVQNSFFRGLSPVEYFFHAMGGRDGLIDTAVKSVTGDTPIVIVENGTPKYVRIGDWIDAHIDGRKEDVTHFPEDRNMELLELAEKVFIPTCDMEGRTSWEELTAVTRHDPGERLYEVTTLSGRTATVAESRTLLVWDQDQDKFVPKNSPDVSVGDCVPVTAVLPGTPVDVQHVCMTTYFPRNEYVYGTDFNLACRAMKEAQGDKFHIPRGWWEATNGITFTLPFTSKAKLTRTTVRSAELRDGCVYPFHAKRDCAHIPDKFVLDYDNGVFIGLFLADGNTSLPSGTVSIAKEDSTVQQFVRDWFDKFSITHRTDVQQKERGFSYSVVGSSTLLARFLDAFVGKGARHKFVPDVAFAAPLDFVRGILSGYISGDGCIGSSGVTTSSTSRRLTEGIAMLLSRLGVFAKISTRQQKSSNLGTVDIAPMHVISIRAQWARRLSAEIDLVMESKNAKMKEMVCAKVHKNFPEQQGVVLDKIVSIKAVPVDLSKNPKLYDVTVPKTLNFAEANGLNYADTSETGYIQRKLVKAMEDCKVQYDMSVRNASGQIIQFLYGEDGMDSTKIEKHKLLYSGVEPLQFAADYSFPRELTRDFSGVLEKHVIGALPEGWHDVTHAHFMRVAADREFLFSQLFPRVSSEPDTLFYPVAFDRILSMAHSIGYQQGQLSDLDPVYAVRKLDELTDHWDDQSRMFGILARMYMSPKRLVLKYRMRKDQFDSVLKVVRQRLTESFAHAGEMVGVVAAQSIGEFSTQMCSSRRTHIRVTGSDLAYSGPIGDFIDDLLEKNGSKVVAIGHDHLVLDLKQDYNIIGVSNEEKTSWKRISQISRHPANGGLVKVYTKSGKTTTATLTHSFLGRTVTGIKEVKGSDLKLGDRIPVAKSIPEVSNPLMIFPIGSYGDVALDGKLGWLCGAYIADGNVSNNAVKITKCIPEFIHNLRDVISEKFGKELNNTHSRMAANPDKNYQAVHDTFTCTHVAEFLGEEFGRGSANKCIPAWVYGANKEFIAGLLQGYFDGDGNCCSGTPDKTMIRAGSISERLMDDMIVLLAYCGIFASKSVESSSTELVKKPFHSIQISRKHGQAFKDQIGFLVQSKAAELDKLISYVNRTKKRSEQELIDKIPCVGDVIARVGKILEIPGQSRNYGGWAMEESVGRATLMKYIGVFEAANAITQIDGVDADIQLLKQAAYSDVIWDEIVRLEYLDDPKEYVYDFTVPGNDSFMVDTCILVHNTLNTFHSAGNATGSTVVRGVPRMRELLSVTRKIKTPSMTIHPDQEICADKLQCIQLLNRLQVLRFDQLVSRTRILYDPTDARTKIKEDEELLQDYALFSQLDPQSCHEEADVANPWLLRIDIDRDVLIDRGVTMIELADAVTEAYEHKVKCIFSNEADKSLTFRIRLDKPDTEDVLTELRALESHIMENLVVWGVRNIERVTMNTRKVTKYRKDVKVYDKYDEWILYTDGTELRTVLGRSGVDPELTTTNDVVEIYDVLGIEAARQALIDEFNDVMQESKINFRHIALLVDSMTHRGRLTSVDRFGINRSDIGVLSKASFEESVEQIITSAVFAENDPMTSIAANVMLGQIAPCGTGQTDVSFDMKQYIKTAEALGVSLSENNVITFAKEDDDDGDEDDRSQQELLESVSRISNFLNPVMMRLNIPPPVKGLKRLSMPRVEVVA